MIRLIKNRVAIVPLENPEMIGHIVIPDVAKTRLNQGFIKYKGPDVIPEYKIGDYVLYSGYSGSDVFIDGEGKLIVMEDEFIIAHISRHPNLPIPGLYFKDKNGEFFEANYEDAMTFISLAFSENNEWRDRFNVRSMETRKLEDYTKAGV